MENWPAGWIGNEVQAYTSKLENARVENGNLIIDCWREGENPYDYSLYFDKKLEARCRCHGLKRSKSL
jgi:hypothetical protein